MIKMAYNWALKNRTNSKINFANIVPCLPACQIVES